MSMLYTDRRICDYCSEKLLVWDRVANWPGKNIIPLTKRRNGEELRAELCDQCLRDIADYIDTEREMEARDLAMRIAERSE